MSTIRRWRAIRGCGTAAAPPPCCCASLIVVSFSGSRSLVLGLDGVQAPRQRPEEGRHLRVTEDERRGEPHRVGYGGVHQESGVLSRPLHLGGERLREHHTPQQAPTPPPIDPPGAPPPQP